MFYLAFVLRRYAFALIILAIHNPIAQLITSLVTTLSVTSTQILLYLVTQKPFKFGIITAYISLNELFTTNFLLVIGQNFVLDASASSKEIRSMTIALLLIALISHLVLSLILTVKGFRQRLKRNLPEPLTRKITKLRSSALSNFSSKNRVTSKTILDISVKEID